MSDPRDRRKCGLHSGHCTSWVSDGGCEVARTKTARTNDLQRNFQLHYIPAVRSVKFPTRRRKLQTCLNGQREVSERPQGKWNNLHVVIRRKTTDSAVDYRVMRACRVPQVRDGLGSRNGQTSSNFTFCRPSSGCLLAAGNALSDHDRACDEGFKCAPPTEHGL